MASASLRTGSADGWRWIHADGRQLPTGTYHQDVYDDSGQYVGTLVVRNTVYRDGKPVPEGEPLEEPK